MSIEKAFRAKLNTDLTTAEGRIRPNELQQKDSGPSVVYYKGGSEQIARTLEDAGGLVAAEFFLFLVSPRSSEAYDDVKAMEERVRNKFDGARGAWPYTGGSVFVQCCRVDDNVDSIEPPAFAEEVGADIITLRVTIIHEQALPTL